MGQVNRNTDLGKWIFEYAKDEKYTTYLEIGTMNGQGTTKCVMDGFEQRQDKSCLLYSVENYYIHLRNAMDYWKGHQQLIFLNGVVTKDHFMTLDEVINNRLFDDNMKNHTNIWYDIEKKSFEDSNLIYDKIPKEIDVLILDGSEFTTYYEWNVLKSHKIKILLMDDTNVIKCNRIFNELLVDPNWKLIFQSNEKNGSAGFEFIGKY